MITIDDREQWLKDRVRRGTIVRGKWVGADEVGRDVACLLAAWSPEAARAKDPRACPADAMPSWLARCTIAIDDRGSEPLWWARVERYAAVIRRVVELPPKRLVRLDYEFRAIALREARTHAGSSIGVVDRVLALCERAAAGKRVTDAELKAAEDAGRAARSAVARAARAAAAAAAWSAEEAASARAARAAAAAWSAEEAAWDRILDGWLTAMERAV